VIVELSGGSKVIGGAASFFGVDPAAPTGGFVSSEGEGTSATLTVASAAGEVVFDCISTKGTATTLTPGAGQTGVWSDVTRTNGGNVMGAASYAPGAASTTMSWTLQDPEYWVLGAIPLLPAPPRPYLVDAMIRLSTEPDAAYRYDAVYEPTASVQVVAAGVLGTQTVTYAVRFENDGINADALRITGTGSSADFAVQYIDGGGVDRTIDVVGAGYVGAVLAPGASVVWMLAVTPLPGAIGGASHTVAVAATSTGDPAWSDQVAAVTTSTSPALAVSKSVDLASAAPGQDVTYTLVATTAPGLSDATSIVLVDSLPPDVGFLVGSAVFDPGTTSLSSTVRYSSDNGATWTYSPGSGSCGAPGGYDYCVTNVRWELAGDMPADQTFSVAFIARVR
jgi:uncharacterized repeat protein (TIGR01451 family)